MSKYVLIVSSLLITASYSLAMEKRESQTLYSFASPVNLSYFPDEQEFVISNNAKHTYIPADTSVTIKVFASEQEPYEEVPTLDSTQKDQESGTNLAFFGFGLGLICGGTCLYMVQKCQPLFSRK